MSRPPRYARGANPSQGDRFFRSLDGETQENHMSARPLSVHAEASHVEAFRCTGSSPGRSGHVRVRLDLELGGTVDTLVGYTLYGPPSRTPVVVLGGISADRHLAPTSDRPGDGWWPGVVGPGEALDTERTSLLGVDWLLPGGPSTGVEPEGPVTSGDQARALATVLDAVGIETVTIVGASYGGMVALAFARLFPSRVRRLVVLCAAHRTHPMATALRSLQRRIVDLACEAGRPRDGVALGRALAMTTYRSALEFDGRFDARPECGTDLVRFPVEGYLEARGDDFAARFTPERFTRLSESIDLHHFEPEDLTVPTVLVSFDTDALVPGWLVEELASHAPGVELHVGLRSIYGHDAFLKETVLVSDVIRSSVGSGVSA